MAAVDQVTSDWPNTIIYFAYAPPVAKERHVLDTLRSHP